MTATIINSALSPAITQTNLVAAIKTAMTDAGFNSVPFDEFTSGTDKILVYDQTFNAATFGKVYLWVKITTALAINQQLYTAWNATTHTGTNGGTASTAITFAAGSQINFKAIKQNTTKEYQLLFVTQSTTVKVLGTLRPASKPSWWDENSYPFYFIPPAATFATLQSTANATMPYTGSSASTFTSSLNNPNMSAANPITSKRDVLAGVVLYPNSLQGVAGRTSDDLVMVAAAGLTRFDTIQIDPGVEEYILINPAVGGLAIRSV